MRTLLLALLMVPGLVMAEVSLKTEAFKIVAVPQTDGSVMEEWRSADQVVPGDKVGYRISYNNTGSDAAEDWPLGDGSEAVGVDMPVELVESLPAGGS